MVHSSHLGKNLVPHSASGLFARPSPWGTCSSYSLPAFLARSRMGQSRRFLRVHGTSGYPPKLTVKADRLVPDRHASALGRPRAAAPSHCGGESRNGGESYPLPKENEADIPGSLLCRC